MLRLFRNIGETVVIPVIDCLITVEGVDDDGIVTLTFSAPRSVEIVRLEVWQRKQREMGASILGERPTGTARE